jgi:hypothetical protein
MLTFAAIPEPFPMGIISLCLIFPPFPMAAAVPVSVAAAVMATAMSMVVVVVGFRIRTGSHCNDLR